MKPDEKRILATIRQDLLIWAGRHRGTGIVEEAMPRFHEIIDSFSALIPAQGRKRRTPHNAMKKGELRGALPFTRAKRVARSFVADYMVIQVKSTVPTSANLVN